MGAIVVDHCIVKSNSIIAAGSVVTRGTLESGCIYAGTPAKKIKEVDQTLFEGEIMRIADNYLKYSG